MNGIKVARVSHIAFFLVTQLRSQVEHLRASGMEVTLVSGKGEALNPFLKETKFPHVCVQIPRDISLWKDLVALVHLYLLFRKKRFQIVHSTTPKAGLLSALAAFLAGVPIRLHTFTGQVWINMSGLKRKIAIFCDKIIMALNTQNYADGRSQVQILKENGIIRSEDQIKILGKGSLAGVDLKRFDPFGLKNEGRAIRTKLGIDGGSKVVIFLGRITRDKGIVELIDAFEEAIKAHHDLHLVLVGPLESEKGPLPDRTLEMIHNHPRIHYEGYSPHPEHYMASADLLCLPSYREGFGTVVIEAAAMGLPTLGTRVQGLVDSIVDGETGLLVPPMDDRSLASAMLDLFTDEQKRLEMGRMARKRAVEYFDSKIIDQLLMKEYQLYMQEKLRD